MRILIVTSDYLPNVSGVATLTHQQALGLHKRGHHVMVLTTTSEAAQPAEPASIPVSRFTTRRTPVWRLHMTQMMLTKTALNWKPDIIWCTTYRGFGLPVYNVCRKLGIPYGVYFHGTELLTENRLHRRPILRAIARRASIVATNSVNSAGLLDDIYNTQAEVITPGVSPAGPGSAATIDKLRNHWLNQSGLSIPSAQAFIFICASRVSRQKGIDVAIQGLAELPYHLKSRSLYVIIGDGPDRASFQKLTAQLGLDRHVLFLEPVSQPNLQAHLAAADAYLQPSQPINGFLESFGISYLEAQASGLPCIATRFGGIGEAIKQGDTGLLVEHSSVEAVRIALVKMIEDTDFYVGASSSAIKWSRQNTWQSHVIKIESQLMLANA